MLQEHDMYMLPCKHCSIVWHITAFEFHTSLAGSLCILLAFVTGCGTEYMPRTPYIGALLPRLRSLWLQHLLPPPLFLVPS